MLLDNNRHQPSHRAPRRGKQVHNLLAPHLTLKRTLDGFDLPSDAPGARQQLLFFTDGMGHTPELAYPPTLLQAPGSSGSGHHGLQMMAWTALLPSRSMICG